MSGFQPASDSDPLKDGQASAAELDQLIREKHCRIVFAESCTGGLAAALMTAHAGISQFFCGSAVTYRDDTKLRWLSVSPETLRNHSAVSPHASLEMANAVLENTPEANVAAAITGHLGPGATKEMDGMIYIAVAFREHDQRDEDIKLVFQSERRLMTSDRFARQAESASRMLEFMAQVIQESF